MKKYNIAIILSIVGGLAFGAARARELNSVKVLSMEEMASVSGLTCPKPDLAGGGKCDEEMDSTGCTNDYGPDWYGPYVYGCNESYWETMNGYTDNDACEPTGGSGCSLVDTDYCRHADFGDCGETWLDAVRGYHCEAVTPGTATATGTFKKVAP